MPIQDWSRPEDAEALLGGQGEGLIFKHSTRCTISAAAAEEVSRFADAHPEVPVYRVLVIESRPVSNAIAERLGVPHASPQAILVRGGKAAFSVSHFDITLEALESAWLVGEAAPRLRTDPAG
jgi:bacillithiol system protein YtxJ